MRGNYEKKQTDHRSMRIAIDLTALSDRWSGLERCAFELTEHMIDISETERFLLIVKNTPPLQVKRLGRRANVSFIRIRSGNKLIANQLMLPAALLRTDADAVLFPVFPMPLLHPLFNRKSLVYGVIADTVCFDVPETQRKLQRLFWQTGLKAQARIARRIFTVSEFSAGRIRENLKVPEERITVAYNGVKIGIGKNVHSTGRDKDTISPGGRVDKENGRMTAAICKKYGIRTPYHLTLSTIEPRKDVPLLLRAYGELKAEGLDLPELVIAGRSGWKDITKDTENDSICFTGAIDEEDLEFLYTGAEAFIFPSCYEGFGLPPLEALACGVRKILVSDAPALREVMGEAAAYFHRRDLHSLKQALKELADGKLKEITEEEAQENLKRFSWEKSARIVLEMIRENVTER